ncbi:MAG: efflux RND transporter periplasmic adaptor subunit [Bacteroidetes bacterium]|nr:efflux RND transporter periplasmic adaptor subunit [Bacteroidota bacterium]
MQIKFSKLYSGTLITLIFLFMFTACNQDKMAYQAAPPSINVVEVIQKDVPIFGYFVGQLYGQEDVSINARVEGFLTGIHFKEGSRVSKGTLLYTIDPEPFKAALASEKSKVAEAQTVLVNAENELARYIPLAEMNAVSKSDLDFAQSKRDASIASVEAAKASLRMAEINLSYTRVKSPITGFIGKTQARIGEFVGKSPNPVILNMVSKIENVRVQFFITETQYLNLAKYYTLHRGREDVKEVRTPTLSLILSDGSTHPHMGVADFINREVDAETGAILVQATFPNPDLILRPGQFSRVKIRVRNLKGALLVPQRCVTELQGQYSVFVVNSENKIESSQIMISDKFGDYYIVEKGLKLSDKIVLEGLQKVGSGMQVVPVVTEFISQIVDQ